MGLNHKKITEKWQKEWAKAKLYEPSVDIAKPAFYLQVAYPYPSGAMHIGHARTYSITDIIARYKRMRGFNSLMPMGWHVSGGPVIATVELLKKKDPKTIKKMTEAFRIPKKDLGELETPEGFINYFINKAETGYKKGFGRLGLGIDWRRELITTDPQYFKFIEWQYRKLYEKGYIVKGKYPIRYCPNDKNAVGDHDLSEGEGVGIQEYTLLKFKFEDKFIMAATLRPETVFGQTNLWVDPKVEYVVAEVEGEQWIISQECLKKLKFQKKTANKIGTVKGKDLIGKTAIAPGIDRAVPILPSQFTDPDIGTGIVTSVPSDAPDDFVALRDLWENEKECKKYGLDCEEVRKIKVIPIIKTQNYGDEAAVKIVEEMKIKNQMEREKLLKAKKIVYKEGFHQGIMNENCGKYAGQPVMKAKEKVKKEMLRKSQAEVYYEMEGKAVCRCSHEVVVAVLDDQWFIKYSDEKWKKESEKTLAKMTIAPELYRKQYENTFGWLEDKPCTRSKGLGTKFPWDETKIIEPLADSTIYMAYFSISHLIKQIEPDQLGDAIFDFVFLGKGRASPVAKKTGANEKLLVEMRENFDYWYPLAFNVSAIELIPNHMSFSIFHHTAIFPKEKRQQGTLNLGMLVIEGEKMASSKGNVKLVNDMTDAIGADMVRFFLMNAVEPWQEMDWRQRDIEQGLKVINGFLEFLLEKAKKVRDAKPLDKVKLTKSADKWMVNELYKKMDKTTEFMENFQIRKAIQEISFGFMPDLKWYEKRNPEDSPEKDAVYKLVIDSWIKAMAPIIPHVCQEIWAEGLKEEGFVAQEEWPDTDEVIEEISASEKLLKNVMADVKNIQEIAKIQQPKQVVIYTAPEWKWTAMEEVVKACAEKPDFGAAMKAVSGNKELKAHTKELAAFVKGGVKKCVEWRDAVKINEFKALANEIDFLEKEFGCTVRVEEADKTDFDPAGKAKNALPLKPAIYLE